jgi:hypothetical protein
MGARVSGDTQRREFLDRARVAASNTRFVPEARLMIPVNVETRFGRHSCSDSVPRVSTVLPATTLIS